MRILKSILRFLFSRRLWVFIGIVLLCLGVWFFGDLIAVGDTKPLDSDLVRLVVIGVIVILWLLSILVALIRAARRNQMFVTELTAVPAKAPTKPGEANVEEVNTKFQSVLAEMKRSKLGKSKFLRDMPWYLMIGPPGTGKTTALRQSGLHFPIDLSDDIKGVGGTRNCDWFFTEQAVLVDTAGRYVQQASDREADAAEWVGFLDLLKKHRGRRALNGIILVLSMNELLGPEAELRNHGREIRKRLAELRERLQIQLPVYLMVTKADLVPGFEAFFANLSTRDREQVWGTTLPVDASLDSVTVERESRTLLQTLETRLVGRMAEDATLSRRAEIFRFPAQMEKVEQPLKILIDAVFGESRYEESAWLRGFYFTSATQEGSPIDRLVGELSGAFGLNATAPERRAYGESRSYFLRDLITNVIFPEAGLGLFDRAAEERRKWIWRGSLAGAGLVVAAAGLAFLFSFLRFSGAIDDQERLFADLSGRLANVASRKAPTDPLDLDLALDAVSAVDAARTVVQLNAFTVLGPSADAELKQAQSIAFDGVVSNVLVPRMVALLETTMWHQVRDPDYLLSALKAYYMMTVPVGYDAEFLKDWWQQQLPLHAPINPFQTDSALTYQLAALDLLGGDETKIAPDKALLAAALESVCTIPLSVWAYKDLMQDPVVTALPNWIPSDQAGPNGTTVLTRLSGKTLRVGLPGAFTFDGFHQTILPLVPQVAERAAKNRAGLAGGCGTSSAGAEATLQTDILKLYSDDFIAQWDGFLHDVRLAPITSLAVATTNLKDLGGPDSALKHLLGAVVTETDLTFEPEAAATATPVPAGGLGAKVSGVVKKVKKIVPGVGNPTEVAPSSGPPPGTDIAAHFAPLKATIQEVDGQPPLLTDTQTAIGALANELQTVLATPDPEATLLARGGLPELTGAIANLSKTLPDPVNGWIAGIAGDTMSVTRDSVLAQLNAYWNADVRPFCTRATDHRYPFDVNQANDVTLDDFGKLFRPAGLIDSFTNEQLAPYIDTSVPIWAWRSDLGLDAATLVPFQRARSIRDALFPGGAGPIMTFTLLPKNLSANASRVTLNLDGQQLIFFNSAPQATKMSWPGTNGTNQISLSFAPLDGSTEVMTTVNGPWAWLRMIRKGKLAATDLPELFHLTLDLGGFSVSFDLTAGSVENPFNLKMFSGFKCPESF